MWSQAWSKESRAMGGNTSLHQGGSFCQEQRSHQEDPRPLASLDSAWWEPMGIKSPVTGLFTKRIRKRMWGIHKRACLEERERIWLAFFLKALTQGLLYCSKPLAKLGLGRWIPRTVSLILFVSIVWCDFVLKAGPTKPSGFYFTFFFFLSFKSINKTLGRNLNADCNNV